MSYLIEFDEQAGWLVLTHWGNTSVPELEEARASVNKKLDEHHCKKILVDAQGVTSQLNTFQYYAIASTHPEHLPPRLHMALVVAPERISDGHFVENVLFNRGMMLRVFTNRDEAVSWLEAN